MQHNHDIAILIHPYVVTFLYHDCINPVTSMTAISSLLQLSDIDSTVFHYFQMEWENPSHHYLGLVMTPKNRQNAVQSFPFLYIGRCVSELQGDICGAIEALDYYASLATTSVGHHVKLDNGDFAYVTKEPYGIVAGKVW